MDLRVAPNLASFSASVASTPGCPAVSPFQLRLPMHFPGCPGTCIFRLCRRRSLELPRFSRPSALLALMLRVAPRLRASSYASWCGGGFPRAFTFRLCLGFEFPGLPESSLPWHRLMVPRVASVPAPSGLPSLRPQVSPSPASTAGSMMTSRFSSNFASSAEPRMNLRVQSGLSQSRLTLDAFSQSHSGFHLPASRPVYLRFQPHPASSCQAGTVFPIPCQVIN